MFSRRQKSLFVLLLCTLGLVYAIASGAQATVLRKAIQHYRDPDSWGTDGRSDCSSRSAISSRPEDDGWERPTTGLLTTTQPVAGTYGFNVFDNLYVWNGTIYIVTPNAKAFLPREFLVSRPVNRGKQATEPTVPTDKELRFVTPAQAEAIFPKDPIAIPGVSMIFYDVDQFMSHFYHWWGEIILGSWRVYSTLATKSGNVDSLPFPGRFILPFVANNRWRDPAGLDGPLMRAAFPTSQIEQADYWTDLITLDAPVIFQRVVLANRVAAHLHSNGVKWHKMIASTMELAAPERYFNPIRERIVKALLGHLPVLDDDGRVVSPQGVMSEMPIVTYISRQGGNRRLKDESHDSLIAALKKLESEGLCEVQIPAMETLTIADQVKLTARSTVVLGVHGNGLTHQLWMPESPRSAVIEIMFPGGYVYDYEMLARNLGHKHYAMHNDTFIAYPKGTTHQGIQRGAFQDFHGNSIPVYGPAVADLIRLRLTGPIDP